MSDKYDLILDVALKILSDKEKKGSPKPFTTSREVFQTLPYEHGFNMNEVVMVLDDDLKKRYDGKNVVYFI